MSVAERIRNERKKKNLSQKQLGEMIMLSRQTVASYEAGRTEPDIATLKKLSEIFGVSLDYLLIGNSTHNNKISAFAVFGCVFILFMGCFGLKQVYMKTRLFFPDFTQTYFFHFVLLPLIAFFSFMNIGNTFFNKKSSVLSKTIVLTFCSVIALNIGCILYQKTTSKQLSGLLFDFWSIQYNNFGLSMLFPSFLGFIKGIYKE